MAPLLVTRSGPKIRHTGSDGTGLDRASRPSVTGLDRASRQHGQYRDGHGSTVGLSTRARKAHVSELRGLFRGVVLGLGPGWRALTESEHKVSALVFDLTHSDASGPEAGSGPVRVKGSRSRRNTYGSGRLRTKWSLDV